MIRKLLAVAGLTTGASSATSPNTGLSGPFRAHSPIFDGPHQVSTIQKTCPCPRRRSRIADCGSRIADREKSLHGQFRHVIFAAGCDFVEIQTLPGSVMSNLEDTDYFTTRANEEAIRSLTSEDDRVSAAHAELAERYHQRARAAKAGAPTPLLFANDIRPNR